MRLLLVGPSAALSSPLLNVLANHRAFSRRVCFPGAHHPLRCFLAPHSHTASTTTCPGQWIRASRDLLAISNAPATSPHTPRSWYKRSEFGIRAASVAPSPSRCELTPPSSVFFSAATVSGAFGEPTCLEPYLRRICSTFTRKPVRRPTRSGDFGASNRLRYGASGTDCSQNMEGIGGKPAWVSFCACSCVFLSEHYGQAWIFILEGPCSDPEDAPF